MQKQRGPQLIKQEEPHDSQLLADSPPPPESSPFSAEPVASHPSPPKNRRWTQQEHTKYVAFLELNRQRLKCKLVRRANSFFREMSGFVASKSPTQCRSYHQKYEAKHKYPHRIIREERKRTLPPLFQDLLARHAPHPSPEPHPSLGPHLLAPPQIPTQLSLGQEPARPLAEGECQTELQGVSTVLIPMPVGASSCPAWPSWQWMFQWWGAGPSPCPPHPSQATFAPLLPPSP